MLAETFTMIRRDDHKGLAARAACGLEQRPERVIDVGHFSGVEVRRVLRVVGRRRSVARMRVENVNPGEPLALLSGDPLPRRRDDRLGPSLGESEVTLRHLTSTHIVVSVESLRQAELPVQWKGSHERSRRQTVLLRQLGDGDGLVVEPEAGVVADAVLEWIASGHDARVRGQGDDGVRVREREADTLGREAIEIRCGGPATVASERIPAEGVDRDEKNILIRGSDHRGILCARPESDCGDSQENHDNRCGQVPSH